LVAVLVYGCSRSPSGNTDGAELGDQQLTDLVKYVSLLGVRARGDLDDPQASRGEQVFEQLGCTGCHVSELITSAFRPLAELREQVIHPYTDLLLHDMGHPRTTRPR
jgi:CxxC motif-containing protein (DUF1111 family)